MSSKKRKPAQHRSGIKGIPPSKIVKMVNYLHLSMIIRSLYTVYGWRDKRIKKFLIQYLVLMHEVRDGRNSISGAVQDCYELTGIDVIALLDTCTAEEVEKILGIKWED